MKKIILFFLLVSMLVLFSGCSASRLEKLQHEYELLQDKYDSLMIEYENITYDIAKTDDLITTLYLYFEEETATYKQAYSAYEDLSMILSNYY